MNNGSNKSMSKERKGDSSLQKCLVFLSSYMVMFLHLGVFFSIGTIFVDMMSTFNATRAETAVIQSTAIAVFLGSGLIFGMVVHKFGAVRCGLVGSSLSSLGIMSSYLTTSIVHMVATIGLVCALGVSCMYISSTVAIGQHFGGRRKLLMMSLQATGVSLGGMAYPYILIYLSEMYGLQGALLIVGGLCMNTIPTCLLWRKHTQTQTQSRANSVKQLQNYQQTLNINVKATEDEITIEKNKNIADSNKSDIFYIKQFPMLYNGSETKWISIAERELKTISSMDDREKEQSLFQSVRSIFNNKSFVLFLLGSVALDPALQFVIILVADVFVDRGLTLNDVTFGLLLMNIANMVGRLIPGIVMQWKKVPTFLCPLLVGLMSTAVLIGFSFSTSRVVSLLILMTSGVPYGMLITMRTVVTTKLVGSKKLPTAMCLLLTASSVGSGVTGPVSGYIRDRFGSYTSPFYLAASMTALATVLFLIGWTTQRMKKPHIRRHSSSEFYLTSL